MHFQRNVYTTMACKMELLIQRLWIIQFCFLNRATQSTMPLSMIIELSETAPDHLDILIWMST